MNHMLLTNDVLLKFAKKCSIIKLMKKRVLVAKSAKNVAQLKQLLARRKVHMRLSKKNASNVMYVLTIVLPRQLKKLIEWWPKNVDN